MNKVIKIFAVWILLFALPVQGFAAATMMNCEKPHSHEAKNITENYNHAMHNGHNEAINHEVTHEHAADIEDAVDNNSTHQSTTTKHACSHCATCTLCCSTSAIVTTSLNVLAQFDNNKATLAYSTPQFTSFVSAGIERPPRSILV